MSKTTQKTSPEHRPALSPDMVGFSLLKLTNLLSRPFFGNFAKQHQLAINEWRAMVVLAAQPGSATELTPLGRIVDKLVARAEEIVLTQE